MTYEFINRMEQFGVVTYDLIIKTDHWEERISTEIERDDGETKDFLAQSIYESILARKESERAKTSVLAKVDSIGLYLENYIQTSPNASIEKLVAINQAVNAVAGSLGIKLESPDIKSLMLSRVKESVKNVRVHFENSTVSSLTETALDQAGKAILSVAQ